MKIFDTHTHYLDSAYDEDRDDVLKKIYKAGVEKVCMISAEIGDAQEIKDFVHEYNNKNLSKKEYPDFYYTVGIHPDEVPAFLPDSIEGSVILNSFEEQASDKYCIGIGEIGLDYYGPQKDDTVKACQKEWFRAQMELAGRCRLPIVVHSREAASDTHEMLKGASDILNDTSGILHCYSYDSEMARLFMKFPIYFGIGGVVTFSNGKKLKAALSDVIPYERVVTETDCPYLSPTPFRGKRNDSSNLQFIIETLNDIYGSNIENSLYENAHNIYKKVQK